MIEMIPNRRDVESHLCRAKEAFEEKGIRYVIYSGIIILSKAILYRFLLLFYRTFKSSRTFTFQGNKYSYFYHWDNATWEKERAVEIPIVWEIIKKYSRRNVLEVGNVLSHYFRFRHDIVDKYEKADGVINQDVVDFQPSKRYDLIVSISTLEHVGWNENDYKNKYEKTGGVTLEHVGRNEKSDMKILCAIRNLKRLLAPGGTMVITVPVGFNFELDKLLREGKIQFTRRFCLKRISKDNEWKEVNWNEIHNAKYGSPFPFANGLVIGIFERK